MRMGRTRFILVLMCLSIGAWVAFAKVAVPLVIESAYRGESLPILNGMIKGQHEHPVSYYLQMWSRITTDGLLYLLVFWLPTLAMSLCYAAFFRRFVGEATPGSLGAIRMWTCGILLLGTLAEDLPSVAQLPIEMRQHGGLLRFLYILPIGFDKFVASESSLWVFQLLTALLLFLGLIGLWTRVVIPLGAFCKFLFLGILIDYSFFWHEGLVPLYVLAVLSCTPCGDGWSVDRLWKVYQGRAVPDADRASPVYGWSRYVCWIVIVPAYVLNGVSKLEEGGLFWWNSTNFKGMLYMDNLNPRWVDWTPFLYLSQAPDILFALVPLTAVTMEVLFGAVLFSRTARRILPFGAIMLHTGIGLLQRFLFIDLILLQFIFWDWTGIRKAVGQRLEASRGRIQVLYDGLCPLCLRTGRLLACLDLFARLELLDFRRLALNDYNRTRKLNLTLEGLEKEMYVVSRGQAYSGFYGYRIIALALPALWPLALWLFLPGISSLGAWVYGYVARNRLKFLLCDSHCAVRPSAEAESAGPITRNEASRGLGFVLAIPGIVVVSLLCWFHYVEFYPFTSWHLYSYNDTSGKVAYFKVFARYEPGMISRARLEDTIGALAYDGRYWSAVQKCFGKTSEEAAGLGWSQRRRDLDICKKFLAAAASAYNKKARPGGKITQYQIEKWIWDFRLNPSDPQYGNLADRFVFEITN
jgi:predicted DCC family thiol-disulfide oxidoreductase YuxK